MEAQLSPLELLATPTVDETGKIEMPPQFIHFFRYMMVKGKTNPEAITHDEVNNYDFSKGFFEQVAGLQYVRPYFDFDEIEDDDQVDDVINWLDSLVPVFGNYSLGGYSTNENAALSLGIKCEPEGGHYVSLHVVYYTTMIASEELMTIIHTHKEKDKPATFDKFNVHPLADYNVYKLKQRVNHGILSGRQLMRHVLSNKIAYPGNFKVRAGAIADELKPETQIITPKGDERIVTMREWSTVIKCIEKEKKEIKNYTIDDLDFDDDDEDKELIRPSDEEMDEILSCFAPEFNVLNHDLIPLLHSPFSIEWLEEHLSKWYNKREHSNGDSCVTSYINKYSRQEMNNKWFYSLVAKIPEKEVADKYRKKYSMREHQGFDINSANESFSSHDLVMKQYDFDNFWDLMDDLKLCIGCCDGIWYLDGEAKTDESMKKILIKHHPFKTNRKITSWGIINKYSDLFQYTGVSFTKDNTSGVINTFRGFKYQPVNHEDCDIQPLLNHIKTVICAGNDEMYDYFMKWFANIIQNVTVKNVTVPIVWGGHGSGKSWIMETLSELMGKYANPNIDDMGKVFGRFNAIIQNKVLIVLNETPEYDNKAAFTESIKSKTAAVKTAGERKGIDAEEIESWANFVMVTNSPAPVIDEVGNRRFIYFKVSDENKGSKEYFNKLCQPFQPKKQGPYVKEMMEKLMWYFINKVNVEGWNSEELINKLSSDVKKSANEQLMRQYYSLDTVSRYLVEHWEEFNATDGMPYPDIDIHGVGTKTVATTLRKYCDPLTRNVHVKTLKETKKCRTWKLKSREHQPDIWNIIDWYAENEAIAEPTGKAEATQ